MKVNLKGNLTGLIYKKGNKDKGELAKLKVRPISKVFIDFTLEDDLSKRTTKSQNILNVIYKLLT